MGEQYKKESTGTEHFARLKKGANMFEIVINPDQAIAFKQGKGEIADALAFPKIFSNAKKGEEANEQSLQESFNTTSVEDIASVIIREGEVQLTTEYRNKLRDQKKKQVAHLLQRNTMDPRTKAPHTVDRILAAMDQAHAKIEEHKSAEEQLEKVAEQLLTILPLKFATKKLNIIIPGAHAAKAYQTLHSYGKVLKETWTNTGNWEGTLELPAGLEPEFYDKINKQTHGDITINVLND